MCISYNLNLFYLIKHWENKKGETKSGFQHRDCNLGDIINRRKFDPNYFETIQVLITLATGENFQFFVFEGELSSLL
jgi:hypothetical protein